MNPAVIVVMGVSGAGKTVIGRELAAALDWHFYDGDDFHSPANVEKMRSGQPLNDDDRRPWLAAIRAVIARTLANRESAVVACSALKQTYRDALVPDGAANAVRFVYLDVPKDVLHERLVGRPHHFMPADLLDSQLDTLEKPKDALWVDGTNTPAQIVASILRTFGQLDQSQTH